MVSIAGFGICLITGFKMEHKLWQTEKACQVEGGNSDILHLATTAKPLLT